MLASDVVEVLDRLDDAGIDAWLDGGWAVDALLAEQTRPHRDLDLIVREDDLPGSRDALAGDGFAEVPGGRDINFVLRDARGREVDLHAIRFAESGDGLYRMESGAEWVFPAAGFEGRGLVDGREVRCLTADVQMLCHAHGYVPSETDFHDMRLLNARLGTRLLSPYDLDVELREAVDEDLPILFEHQRDPEANRMAAFPAREWGTFVAHESRVRSDRAITNRTIVVDGQVAGSVVSWTSDGERDVGYWLGREFWGRGIGTRALAIFLGVDPTRPLHARVAKHNVASLRVLEKCGFRIVGEDRWSPDGGAESEEYIVRLDG